MCATSSQCEQYVASSAKTILLAHTLHLRPGNCMTLTRAKLLHSAGKYKQTRRLRTTKRVEMCRSAGASGIQDPSGYKDFGPLDLSESTGKNPAAQSARTPGRCRVRFSHKNVRLIFLKGKRRWRAAIQNASAISQCVWSCGRGGGRGLGRCRR
jgi:hypothetical protein